MDPTEATPESIDDTAPPRHDYGPLRTYEVTWTNGHAERVQGHQVMIPSDLGFDVGHLFGGTRRATRPRVMIHGEFDGHWRLVLAADEALIAMVRDVTDGERFGDVIA